MLYDPKWQQTVLDPDKQVLLNAADYIEQHGWVQNTEYDRDRVCAWGAIKRVTKDTSFSRYVAIQILANYLGVAPDQILKWNDYKGRTKEDVISVLRGAGLS